MNCNVNDSVSISPEHLQTCSACYLHKIIVGGKFAYYQRDVSMNYRICAGHAVKNEPFRFIILHVDLPGF